MGGSGRRNWLQHGVELHHGFDVVLRFFVIGNFVARTLHRAFTRVVRGECQLQLAGEQVEQVTQIPRTGLDVGARISEFFLDRVFAVACHTVPAGGVGHQLHQPHRTFGRHCHRVKARFGGNQRLQQCVIHAVGAGRFLQMDAQFFVSG